MDSRRSQIIIKRKFQQRLIIYVISIALITINVILMVAELLDTRFGADTSLFSLRHFLRMFLRSSPSIPTPREHSRSPR